MGLNTNGIKKPFPFIARIRALRESKSKEFDYSHKKPSV